jgi:hypothetical protein
MKKELLFAAVAGLTLVSAHPPESHDIGPRAREARSGYPPCSRTVTDRCIQLYERGVRTAANLAQNATSLGGPEEVDEDIDVSYAGDHLQRAPAHHPPAHPDAHHPGSHRERVHVATAAPRHYPPCSAALRDHCSQQRHREVHRVVRHEPPRRLAMRIRRAGERG